MYSVNRIKIFAKKKKNNNKFLGFPILRTETQKIFFHLTRTCGVSMDRSSKMILRFLTSFFSKPNSLRERHFQSEERIKYRGVTKRSQTSILIQLKTEAVTKQIYDYTANFYRLLTISINNYSTSSVTTLTAALYPTGQIRGRPMFSSGLPVAEMMLQIISLQVRLADKPKNLRRYSTQEKILALVLLKGSPKNYSMLQKIFILPSRRTLNSFTQTVKFRPGLNEHLLRQLTSQISTWDDRKKLCSVVFDEVSLTPHLSFVESEDRVDGFVDFGEPQKKLCDHALVFMVRGIVGSWRQPFAYYLCEGTTPAAKLKNILRDVIDAITHIGLRPKAVVCDQGSTFQACLKSLREDMRRCQEQQRLTDNQVLINGHVLYIFFDPPHLIKGIRNNFLTKDMLFRGKVAKWSDIVEVYKADCEVGDIRMLHKLTDEHVIPEKIKKMKVKNCTQTLSEKTAAMLNYSSKFGTHADGTPVSSTMGSTAEAVLFWDRLFDSVNGSRGGSAPGKMRGPVKEVAGVSRHVEFWQEAIRTLNNISFVEPNTTQRKYVPSLRNWILTLKSFISLWSELKLEGVSLWYTRNMNQDPLENFFGRVRALNHRNNSPSPYTFQCTFKSLLITDILGPQSRNTNCEADAGETLVGFELFTELENTCDTNEVSSVAGPSASVPATSGLAGAGEAIPLLQQARIEKQNVHSSAFTAGYVSRILIKSFECQACNKTIQSEVISPIHSWICHRERSSLKGKNLNYPTPKFVQIFRELVKCINRYLDNFAHRPDVVKNIRLHFLNSIDVEFLGCAQHHSQLFMIIVCRVQIHNWCNSINKILRGSFSEKLSPHLKSPMQAMALKKYKSFRLRKKGTHNSYG
ncbi:hypothetical protein ABMA27_010940 [Loxostege sticticalis]|uniref:Transposable element P transposase n=1 Tax=Loxostege sticticalis TaxID=481309 RepID=A0ABR3H2S5_LOXSC